VFEAEFELNALMRADATTRAAFYKAMKALGAITADEIRQKENWPALTDEQKKELAPPPPVSPASPQISQGGQQLQLVNGSNGSVNGNGNGAMPAISRS
jgi:hypothetical protein